MIAMLVLEGFRVMIIGIGLAVSCFFFCVSYVAFLLYSLWHSDIGDWDYFAILSFSISIV